MRTTLFDTDNWREIGQTLMRNKTRTFLTGFGIFWGVAMLALLTGGARGAEDMLRRNFAGFVTNCAGFIPQTTSMPYDGYPKDRQVMFDLTDVELLRDALPALDAIAPIYQKWGNSELRHGRRTASGGIIATDADYARVVTPRMYGGRFINEADVAQERRVAVLGKDLASALFPDGDAVGSDITVDGMSYTVTGIAGNMSDITVGMELDKAVLVPSSTFRRANGWGDKVGFIMVTARDGYAMDDLVPHIRGLLGRRHHLHPDDNSAIWVMNIAHEFETVDKLFTGIRLAAWFIGFATLLAGVIGIGNIMWVIVKERTQEIGVRRAVGARPADITVQVLCEGLALTLASGLGGIVFATLLLAVAQSRFNPPDAVSEAHFQMSLTAAAGILCLFTLLGTLAGLLPAAKAMGIKPVEALNTK